MRIPGGEWNQSTILDEVGVENDQIRTAIRLFEERIPIGADQILGLRRQGAGEHNNIDLRQDLAEVIDRLDGIDSALREVSRPVHANNAHAERLGKLCDPLPDFSQSDDRDSFAAELLFTHLGIADHRTPHVIALPVAGEMKVAAQ